MKKKKWVWSKVLSSKEEQEAKLEEGKLMVDEDA